MSSAVTRLFRVPRLAQLLTRRGMSSKVATVETSTTDAVIGLTAFMITFLVPSGYILSSLEDYKTRE